MRYRSRRRRITGYRLANADGSETRFGQFCSGSHIARNLGAILADTGNQRGSIQRPTVMTAFLRTPIRSRQLVVPVVAFIALAGVATSCGSATPTTTASDEASASAPVSGESEQAACRGPAPWPTGTATPAPELPPGFESPPLVAEPDTGPAEVRSEMPIPTTTPTPQVTARPSPVDLVGSRPASGALAPPEQLEQSTVVLRIDDTEYSGSGVVFLDNGPFARLIVGSAGRHMQFHFPVDQVGTDEPIQLGDNMPSLIYGGDAVSSGDFEVVDGPASNSSRIHFINEVATDLQDQDPNRPVDAWVGGSFDFSVCETGAPVAHRFSGSFHLAGLANHRSWNCEWRDDAPDIHYPVTWCGFTERES